MQRRECRSGQNIAVSVICYFRSLYPCSAVQCCSPSTPYTAALCRSLHILCLDVQCCCFDSPSPAAAQKTDLGQGLIDYLGLRIVLFVWKGGSFWLFIHFSAKKQKANPIQKCQKSNWVLCANFLHWKSQNLCLCSQRHHRHFLITTTTLMIIEEESRWVWLMPPTGEGSAG